MQKRMLGTSKKKKYENRQKKKRNAKDESIKND